jgi:putative transposase
MRQNPESYFKNSPEISPLSVLMYVRFPLSLRSIEDLLHERGIDICHESVRLWVDRFGNCFTSKIRRRRAEAMRQVRQWRGHLHEVFVKIRGKTHYLWCAVDHEGEVLEACVTKMCDKAAAWRGISIRDQPQKLTGTPLFVNGATFSLNSTCSCVKFGD